jgi:hypothetical protein
MKPPGEALISLLESARDPVFLIAPFIKHDAMARLLNAVPKEVPVTCVTRWRPDEVASGVSDLEVFDLLNERADSKLLLEGHLHAKLYRTGGRRLIGSANLTGRALGWHEPANKELLLGFDGPSPEIDEFEQALFAAVTPATSQVRESVAAAAEALMKSFPQRMWVPPANGDLLLSTSYWLPTCSRPDLLFNVYDGSIGDMLLSNSRVLAENDLTFLEPPLGLSRQNFEAFVGAMLRQVRWIQDLDRQTNEGLTDHQAVITIAQSLPANHGFSPEALWNVTKEWLVYFFPNEYDRIPAGEMLRRRRRAI